MKRQHSGNHSAMNPMDIQSVDMANHTGGFDMGGELFWIEVFQAGTITVKWANGTAPMQKVVQEAGMILCLAESVSYDLGDTIQTFDIYL